MKMKQLRHEKKIYRELERMRKSRTFESSTDRTGQEPDDILNMSAAQRLRMIHAEKMSVPKAERKTPDAKADQLPLPTTLAVDFLPIKKIKNGTIYTDDGRYVKVLEVLPINFLLKSREEQEQVIYDFEKFLRIAPDNFQIKVLAKKTDISSYLQRLNENIACEPDEKCRAMMEDSRKLLIDLGQNEAISRRFFLAFEAPKQELRMQTEEEIERVLCRMRDRTLTYLQEAEGQVNQRMLEQHLMVKPSTASGIVGRLEEKGLVRRQTSDSDGRCRILALTDSGRQFYRQFLAIAEQVNQQAAQGFSPEERDTLRRLLLRLADNLSETQEDTE